MPLLPAPRRLPIHLQWTAKLTSILATLPSVVTRVVTMRVSMLLPLFLLTVLPGAPAAALEISYSKLNPFSGQPYASENLLLKGSIVAGDYDKLMAVLRADPERFLKSQGVTLASPGGDVQEAIRIARVIKGTYAPVRVGSAMGKCVSACFLIFAAATQRESSLEHLGIHRPYINARRGATMSPSEMEAFQKRVLREARAYLTDLDVPTNLIDKMFQNASTEVHWLNRKEVEVQLGRRPPWYEQFLISRCNFSKSLEQKFYASADPEERKELVVKLVAAERCGKELARPEARTFLQAELKRADEAAARAGSAEKAEK